LAGALAVVVAGLVSGVLSGRRGSEVRR
jgi:hypothetical protein